MAFPQIQIATGNITASTSGTAIFPANVTARSSIQVFIAEANVTGAVTSVTDSVGNLYSFLDAGANGSSMNLWQFSSKNVSGGPTTITVNTSTSRTCTFIAIEYSNLMPGNTLALSCDPNTQNGGTGTATAVTTSTNITPKGTNALEIIYAANLSGFAYSVAAGWTNIYNNSNGATINLGISDRLTGVPAAKSDAITQSGVGAWLCRRISMATLYTQANNYQFVKVGDGMSVSEKIR